ncbi:MULTISPECIES: metal-sensing transcriptional repressor [Clostridia]|uniref:Metal-sensing transcriptional repressor n=1 Tax=Ruminococcus difficilis TaxID=2763069 RepID=A0A934WTX5_9FIRM|nr:MULTISPECIES: metal-sensing transcriptional repressor [Clostridia]MBK6089903.1 metal-sensing transcriptional repressor [Ruminococcus difficilis]MBU5473660.1 metal-sensing transcriptional repressor [Roseburia sp. MSJ-14]MEE3491827.1 metal-sensing transcriptional repressor [Ruminococcus sp.]
MPCEHCLSQKKTERTEEEKKKLINRLSRIEGQIRGIRNLVENDAYCVDILTQSAAAKNAFAAFNRELLRRHIEGCVVRDIKNDEADIDELMDIIGKLMK